jgi:cell pole-organizing protein PopZ
VKTRAHEAINRRLETLARLAARVRDNRHLSDAHRVALSDLLEAQRRGLSALDEKIQADTGSETLKTDVKAIVTDYRVYLLTVPKVHLVIGADTELAAAAKLDEVATRLQAKVDEAAAAGEDVAEAQRHLDAMKGKDSETRTRASGVAGAVLPLVPQDYPGNKPVLEAGQTALKAGRSALHDAGRLARQVVADLKALRTS